MKKQHLILFAVLAVFAVFSCEKENLDEKQAVPPSKTDDLSIQKEVDVILAGLKDSIAIGGLDLSNEAEYRSLQEANAEVMPSLRPENQIEQRDSWVWVETPSVVNQGREGSCVSFSAAYAVVSYYLNAIHEMPYTTSGALRSPEFLYNLTKLPGDCAAGTNFETAFGFLRNYGVCSWADMPYTDGGCSTRPNNTQWARAATGRIAGWRSLYKNVDNLKAFIDKGYPIIAGFQIDDWFSYQTANSPFVWDRMGGRQHGGHAVVIVGYNDEYEVFLVQNSWGKGVHDGGYFYLSYDLAPYLDRYYVLDPVF